MTADLEQAAAALGDLTGQVAFLGGATVGLWFTDPAARAPRITFDVDVVVEVVTLGAYERFQAELRGRGFAEDIESGVIGRMLDAVPMEPRLAGLRGRWLRPATEAAIPRTLPSGVVVRVVPPAWLAVTKLEAFADRGAGDCLGRDFEDLVLLIDAREELASELDALPAPAQAYVRDQFARIAQLATFAYGVEGALLGAGAAARATAVTIPRITRLAGD